MYACKIQENRRSPSRNRRQSLTFVLSLKIKQIKVCTFQRSGEITDFSQRLPAGAKYCSLFCLFQSIPNFYQPITAPRTKKCWFGRLQTPFMLSSCKKPNFWMCRLPARDVVCLQAKAFLGSAPPVWGECEAVATFKAGSYFGELAMLTGAPRLVQFQSIVVFIITGQYYRNPCVQYSKWRLMATKP